ncbi:hypothetical protein MMC25_001278 [Agyrium rufum]|nr:hypothetical protein [Agyrium rufum]
MADYSKLTVVKLKDELKTRGLPQTGLKAALVARLEEHDAQESAQPNGDVAENDARLATADVEEPQSVEPVQEATIAAVETNGAAIEQSEADNIAPTPPGHSPSAPTNSDVLIEQGPSILPTSEPTQPTGSVAELDTQMTDAPEVQDTIEKSSVQPIDVATSIPEIPPEPSVLTELPQPDTPTVLTQAANTQEVVEDSRKRKRRSQSPPPSSLDSSVKRAKALDGSPRIALKEDELTLLADPTLEDRMVVEEKSLREIVTTPLISAEAQEQAPEPELQEKTQREAEVAIQPPAALMNGNGQDDPMEDANTGPVSTDSQPETSMQQDSEPTVKEQITRDPVMNEAEPSTQAPTQASPQSKPTADSRFKSLFTAQVSQQTALPSDHPTRRSLSPTPDRVVTPAIHSATPALYIRNLMRPLRPDQLKSYLLSLALPRNGSPPSSPSSLIRTFFLDPVRTHAFVLFETTTQASRVRAALHDRVWPDERSRKPLWVDFVPEEKIEKWISLESGGDGTGSAQPVVRGRGSAAGSKRWEVVYEDEGEKGVVAYLQEADPRKEVPGALVGGGAVGGRPGDLGQRVGSMSNNNTMPPPPKTPIISKPDLGGRGFKTLDQLFRSTIAKPMLYFLPVDEDLADKRLDRLAEGRGGGRGGDEMRRFSFEDEEIVDKGPEFGFRRGGGGGGGGRGGGDGYRGGRGGGGRFTGDSWRGR